MSAERPIAVGDLVQLLSCRNPAHNALSGSFRTVHEPAHIYLGEWRLDPPDFHNGKRMTWDSRRLKRIPPLDELEGVKTDEPVRETA